MSTKVLVCGAGGFIGRALCQALRAAGHEVIEGRSSGYDFTQLLAAADWAPRLQGVDAVVNAVGVLRDSAKRPMELVHSGAPIALFEACAQAGVRRVVQVSALGVVGNSTQYAQTKIAADQSLLALHEAGQLRASVVRPSIVYGRGGASSQLFMNLARLPLLVLPGAALRAKVQPVAATDLAAAVVNLLRPQADAPALVSAVGPRPLSLSDFIGSLRAQLGHGMARLVSLPEWASRWSARVGDHLPMQPWCSESLALLQQDNADDPAPFAALLGRPAIAPEDLVRLAWSR
ncbi:NAD-dependent epimerase/dehydratase family protein [Burkholderiaceae bacterium UC74_6]